MVFLKKYVRILAEIEKAMISLIQKCRFRENFENNDGTLTGYLLNFTFLNAKHV